MARQTRREFLKTTATVGGALAFTPYAGWAQSDVTAAATEDLGSLVMGIARWQSGVDAEDRTVATKLTEQAIAALGGMERFVSRGDVIWIKPSIGWNRAPELAANTNPHVVATLARLCFTAGAKKVKIGDNSCHTASQTYQTSGIEAAAREVDAEMIYLDERRFKDVALNGKRLDSWPLYPEIIDCDLVINVPVVKHHSLSRVSLGMKNYMGIIGGDRGLWHQALPECLCDITAFMKPRLCVLDGFRALIAHGPQGGNPADVKRMNVVAASTDIVALDSFGAELLGHKPESIATVRAGSAAGLGQMDYRSVPRSEVIVS